MRFETKSISKYAVMDGALSTLMHFRLKTLSYPLKFFWLLSTLKGSQAMRHLATLSEVKIFDCLKRSFENASSSV